jgi:hypothetical protein
MHPPMFSSFLNAQRRPPRLGPDTDWLNDFGCSPHCAFQGALTLALVKVLSVPKALRGDTTRGQRWIYLTSLDIR